MTCHYCSCNVVLRHKGDGEIDSMTWHHLISLYTNTQLYHCFLGRITLIEQHMVIAPTSQLILCLFQIALSNTSKRNKWFVNMQPVVIGRLL